MRWNERERSSNHIEEEESGWVESGWVESGEKIIYKHNDTQCLATPLVEPRHLCTTKAGFTSNSWNLAS